MLDPEWLRCDSRPLKCLTGAAPQPPALWLLAELLRVSGLTQTADGVTGLVTLEGIISGLLWEQV